MSDVDEHSEAVHLPYRLGAQLGKATVSDPRCLHVGKFIDMVVDELQRAPAPVVKLLQTFDTTLERTSALDGQDYARAFTDLIRLRDLREAEAVDPPFKSAKLELVVLPALADHWVAVVVCHRTGFAGIPLLAPFQNQAVGDGADDDRRHTVLGHRGEQAAIAFMSNVLVFTHVFVNPTDMTVHVDTPQISHCNRAPCALRSR